VNSAKWDDIKMGTSQLDSRPIYLYEIQDRSLDAITSNYITEHNLKKNNNNNFNYKSNNKHSVHAKTVFSGTSGDGHATDDRYGSSGIICDNDTRARLLYAPNGVI